MTSSRPVHRSPAPETPTANDGESSVVAESHAGVERKHERKDGAGTAGAERAIHPKYAPRQGRKVLNAQRVAATSAAARIASLVFFERRGAVGRLLGVKPPTIERWENGEQPFTLRDVIASGPESMERCASALNALARAPRAGPLTALELVLLTLDIEKLAGDVAAGVRRTAANGKIEADEKPRDLKAFRKLRDVLTNVIDSYENTPTEGT